MKKKLLQEGLEEVCGNLLSEDERYVLVLADMGRCSFSDFFLETYKKQIFNFGIAEQNAVAICGGMAASGLKPIFVTFCAFLTRRAFDQIVNSIATPSYKVILVGVRAGISESGGMSHCNITDIGMLKTIPNLELYEACSAAQLVSLMKMAAQREKPVYIRLCDEYDLRYSLIADYNIVSGGSKIIKEGQKVVIFAYGKMVSRALRVYQELKKAGIEITVVNVYSLKPIDKETIIYCLANHVYAYVLEEHYYKTGLMEEMLFIKEEKKLDIEIYSLGIKSNLICSGLQSDIHSKYIMSCDEIVSNIKMNLE